MIMKKRACHCCNGTGQEIDQRALGLELRVLRKEAGLSLHAVSRRLKISAAYLSDLERGNRNWSNGLYDRFMEALKGKTA